MEDNSNIESVIYVLFSPRSQKYIRYSSGSWGPSHYTTDDVGEAMKFATYKEAIFECDPNQQWTVQESWSSNDILVPVKFKQTIKYEKLNN